MEYRETSSNNHWYRAHFNAKASSWSGGLFQGIVSHSGIVQRNCKWSQVGRKLVLGDSVLAVPTERW